MAVTIRCMDMPDSCMECAFLFDEMGCRITGTAFWKYWPSDVLPNKSFGRLPDCPLAQDAHSDNYDVHNHAIYEEGFQVMEGIGRAHYIGFGCGETFLDACKDYIAKTGYGEIKTDANGNEYACEWGCRWFPTLEEAQRSFG